MATKRLHECLYCGFTWQPASLISNSWVPESVKQCLKCKDKNIRVKEVETVDYYHKREGRKK